ncbi:hypothetical protein B7494_g4111, partial [Chlorociboria aeruginascens]
MMSSSTADGSEDVNDFLQRIKELGDRRDQEDEERNRKLEEEILQGRKERQARRAERARSISPTKSSPANTPITNKTPVAQSSGRTEFVTPTQSESRHDAVLDDAMSRFTSSSPTKEISSSDSARDIGEPDFKHTSAVKSSPSSAMPPRNSPLSWQRRPDSQSSDRPRSRPLSMVATENAARSPRATPEPFSASAIESTPSREQIAQSLASKDPAWFRQTPDRGTNSPAYRRNQVEDDERSDYSSNSARVQMPGMSNENSRPEKTTYEIEDSALSPSKSALFGSGPRSLYQPTIGGISGIGSPIPLTSAQRLDPPSTDSKFEGRTPAMSPSQGRISPERFDRPISPTKGMGGFVQSAMMKRSDSVNKRWSVQSPGLNRGNSVASNRSSRDSVANVSMPSPQDFQSHRLSRDPSPLSPSRPGSSHSNATLTQEERPGTSNSMRSSTTATTNNDVFVKPALPASRSQGISDTKISTQTSDSTSGRTDASLPASPTKTMDTRRWSPTKASWLESALNKPDSPKPKATPPPQQPAWMSEINKAKQKNSVDLGRGTTVAHKHEVSIGGLLRSPPPGGLAKPISIGGLPLGFSSGATIKRPDSRGSQDSRTTPDKGDLVGRSSPANDKIKPETPPKKDFRSSLKSRQPPTGSNGKEEPEFRNVFGQLRRTKTQNYIAPDELKDNITRGKAALNMTGGPKKTERTDQFKEAILKKKEDFKKAQLEGKGVTRSVTGGSQDAELPEALAKRKALGKTDPVAEKVSPDPPSQQHTILESSKSRVSQEGTTPSRLQGKEAIGGKLASRFNPALAGMLARGPPSAPSDSSRSSSLASTQRAVSMSTSTTAPDVSDPGPQLTHMTKARARGPRRKAPSTVSAAVTTSGPEPLIATEANQLDSEPKLSDALQTPKTVETSQANIENPVSQPSSPRKLDLKRRSQFLQEVSNKSNNGASQLETPKSLSPTKKANTPEISVKTEEPRSEPKASSTPRSKPIAPNKSPTLNTTTYNKSPNLSQSQESPDSAKLRPLPLSPIKVNAAPQVISPKPVTQIESKQSDQDVQEPQTTISVKNVSAVWDRPSNANVTDPLSARSPIKLPTKADENAAMIRAGLRLASPEVGKKPVGLGLQIGNSSRPLPNPPTKGLSSACASLMPSTPTETANSPVPQTSEASKLVTDFFKGHKSAPDFIADTGEILSARPNQTSDIKTLRSALFHLTEDGKKVAVPTHQERVLFEQNMYICVHSFRNQAGKKVTEVYFWSGDEVSLSTVGEAEIFAQRESRSAGGKLVKIRQGKETPEFFQALGGIIIIRRGSANKYDSLAPHILCGRQHFGQIAFDEVDYSPTSLCSGFPYLIAAQNGKSYLWKGKGSGIDELSCARLIGMDFGLTGEIEEVEDGTETTSFMKIFGNSVTIPKSADHWRLKPNYSKYCARLFCADANARTQIVEISPFSQADISPSHVYILDAFFEIYIIVGCQAQYQYAAFHNALLFAQEYGILAAGSEDRPFVPVSTVVLEGAPKDLKSVFRKWRDGLSPATVQSPTTANVELGSNIAPFRSATVYYGLTVFSYKITMVRIRRVKCDETKPSCQRCANTGRRCDGYSSDILASNPADRSLCILQRLSTQFSGSTQERMGFSFFITNTAPELSGYYSLSFWESLILQAAIVEPSLRHAVIAIGSLHKDFSNRHLSLETKTEQARTSTGFAIDQYTKAIGHLRRSLANGQQAPLTALMSCILFVCFDSLRGHFESAMIHLQSGLKILRTVRLRSHTPNHMIETYIAPIFLRLSIQAILYIDTRSGVERYKFAKNIIDATTLDAQMPATFNSLEEARLFMNKTADTVFNTTYLCDPCLPMSLQTPEAISLLSRCNSMLTTWNSAFEKLMKIHSPAFTSKQLRGVALCKIHHCAIKIMCAVIPSIDDERETKYALNNREQYWKFMDDFTCILNLSRSLIKADEQDTLEGKTAGTFSTDMGLVAPLYFVCTKSPHLPTRQMAMELLARYPRKEGMWDSVATVRLIKEFWVLESRFVNRVGEKGSQRVQMTDLVDLVLKDGMQWEWVV